MSCTQRGRCAKAMKTPAADSPLNPKRPSVWQRAEAGDRESFRRRRQGPVVGAEGAQGEVVGVEHIDLRAVIPGVADGDGGGDLRAADYDRVVVDYGAGIIEMLV